MNELSPFHLAIPVTDLQEARTFYGTVLGCEEGRSDGHWVDFNFFGHQLVLHQSSPNKTANTAHNPVDGHEVPVPHFGVVLEWSDWETLSKQLILQNIQFEINPYIRFKGEPGEQGTFFFKDPSGNALEFKAFKNRQHLFAK